MSLDVYLEGENEIDVYSAYITHNLGDMAAEAGIYEALWRPEEVGITCAKQLVEPLTEGLKRMKADRARFEKFNSSNGWGLYENFVPWIERYLQACIDHPEAKVKDLPMSVSETAYTACTTAPQLLASAMGTPCYRETKKRAGGFLRLAQHLPASCQTVLTRST